MISPIRILVASLMLCASLATHAEDHYIVSHVYDGDTIELKNENGRLKLRLTDIDAPERNQKHGQKARRALTNLCRTNGIAIHVKFLDKDKYNRHLGRLQCGQTDASLYMAQHGHAWFNEKFSDNLDVKQAADNARQQRIGLWSAEDPLPPWVWRRLHGDAYLRAK